GNLAKCRNDSALLGRQHRVKSLKKRTGFLVPPLQQRTVAFIVGHTPCRSNEPEIKRSPAHPSSGIAAVLPVQGGGFLDVCNLAESARHQREPRIVHGRRI